jgi:hypothetical protein
MTTRRPARRFLDAGSASLTQRPSAPARRSRSNKLHAGAATGGRGYLPLCAFTLLCQNEFKSASGKRSENAAVTRSSVAHCKTWRDFAAVRISRHERGVHTLCNAGRWDQDQDNSLFFQRAPPIPAACLPPPATCRPRTRRLPSSFDTKNVAPRYDAGYECELPSNVRTELISPRRPRILERPKTSAPRPSGENQALSLGLCYSNAGCRLDCIVDQLQDA